MNILDIIIIVLLISAMILGFNRGLVLQLVSLAGLVVSYIVAYRYYSPFADFLKSIISLQSFFDYGKYNGITQGLHLEVYIYNAIAFVLLFITVKIVMTWIGQLLHVIFKVPGLHFINRWGGAALSLIEALVLITIVLEVLKIVPQDQIQHQLQNSLVATNIFDHLSVVSNLFQHLWNTTVLQKNT